MPWTYTRRERNRIIGISLIVATVLICSVLVYVSLEYTSVPHKQTIHSRRLSRKSGNMAKDCTSTCSTEDCVLHAALLLKLLDPEVDQCEDFYCLSCGKFLEEFGKEDNYSTFDEYTKRLNLEMKDILDNLEADSESASGKLKMVYDTCMDIRSSELEAISSGLQFLRELGIPSWPHITSDFEFSESGLAKALGILAAHSEYSFISITNQLVDGKPIYNASVGRDEKLRASRSKAFKDLYFLNRSMEYFGIEGESLLHYVTDTVFPFKNLFISSNRRKECESENLTDVFLDCSKNVDDDWRFLCEIVETFVDVANVNHMLSKDNIVIPCKETLYVENFLQTIEELPDSTIARLLGLYFFLMHLEDLNFHFRLIKRQEQDHDPLQEEKLLPLNRWEHCVQWITHHMVHALAQEYMKNVLTEPVLLEVKEMIDECFMEVNDLISEQKWLNEEEKAFVIEKINLTTSLNVQMDMYLNETLVNDFYKEFHPTSGSFLRNVLERQRIFFSTDMVENRENHRIKNLTPFSVNAGVTPELIDIGFGNFRFPQYIPGQPRFLNAIRVAIVIGHELGHAIETAFGNFTRNESLKNFDDRKLCFQNQYANFTIESLGLNVDAQMTEPENLADSLAIILIDRLLRKYASSGEEYSLPSVPYTTKQLIYFIISQFECIKTSKERDQYLLEYDSHPLGRFRVAGIMQNSKEFSKAFNCPEGSYMNPTSKCLFLDEN